MKYKKGQIEGLLIFMMIIIFFMYLGTSNIPTSYDDCVKDCKQIHKEDYRYNETSYNSFIEDYEHYTLINRTALKEFCYKQCKNQNT